MSDQLSEGRAPSGTCGADRAAGEVGFCGETNDVRVALATRHYGEEPPLTGTGGSGAVFFSGCTLRCSFCQNCRLSRGESGRLIDPDELSRVFLTLERRGAEYINLVTGTHFAPQIAAALSLARKEGLALPVVWNTSGYENSAGLDIIENFVDVYLSDLKTLDPQLASKLFKARDYPEMAAAAIQRMAEMGHPVFDNGGALTSGTIVRHLVLPGLLQNTREVLEWFGEHLEGRALLSLMFQYLPLAGQSSVAPERTIEDAEYYQVIGMLEKLGIEDGFVQEPDHASPWMPDFDAPNPFPDGYSKVVWHWKHGFIA